MLSWSRGCVTEQGERERVSSLARLGERRARGKEIRGGQREKRVSRESRTAGSARLFWCSRVRLHEICPRREIRLLDGWRECEGGSGATVSPISSVGIEVIVNKVWERGGRLARYSVKSRSIDVEIAELFSKNYIWLEAIRTNVHFYGRLEF